MGSQCSVGQETAVNKLPKNCLLCQDKLIEYIFTIEGPGLDNIFSLVQSQIYLHIL